MGSSPNSPGSVETADLVAYLDGELADPEAQRVARQATRDEPTRREVEALRETWGLLDHLPRARADEDFGTRTLTLLRGDSEGTEDSSEIASDEVARRSRRWRAAGLATLVVASLGLGAWFTGRAWADRNTRLARQLSLAEHLDDYRAVGSTEFLRWLDESDTFDDAQ